ncbi:MAG: hypothetical protein K6B39_04445 [Lachnospiraceae bacterium]|nr:hypothetical protein [Lachnospiraceae bacterium]
MKRRYRVWCALVFLWIAMSVAYADNGPKPVVSVTVKNGNGAACYATLLCGREQYGPYCTTEIEKRWNDRAETAVWEAFATYRDSDGFCFLQELWDLRSEWKFAWEYCPPREFKLLLYWPDEGRFAVSEITEAKEFYSLFEVDAAEIYFPEDGATGSIRITPVDSTGYRIRAFVKRVLLTLAAELVIALAFFFRTKREWLVIIAANVVTQIALGLFAALTVVRGGKNMQFYVLLALLELGVAVVEAVIYVLILRKASAKRRPAPVYIAYAVLANAASYIAGLMIDGQLLETLRLLSFMD